MQKCPLAVNTAAHMLEGVMGHRHSFSLPQVVIPAKVSHILSTVAIWNTHINFFFLLSFTNFTSIIWHSCLWSSSYQTPVPPDSCRCSLEAKTRGSVKKERRRGIIQLEDVKEHWSKNLVKDRAMYSALNHSLHCHPQQNIPLQL